MAMVDVEAVRKILHEFTRPDEGHFAITELSLLYVAEYVAARLDAAPNEVDKLLGDVRWGRKALIKRAVKEGSVVAMPHHDWTLPLIREEDGLAIRSMCEPPPGF